MCECGFFAKSAVPSRGTTQYMGTSLTKWVGRSVSRLSSSSCSFSSCSTGASLRISDPCLHKLMHVGISR